MNENDAALREEIAFIRRAIEQGRGYAETRSLDMFLWGLAIAAGYLGTYATVVGWWRVDIDWFWTVCIVLPWIYSLRGAFMRRDAQPHVTPSLQGLRALWLGCGIFLTALSILLKMTGEMRQGWYNAVAAGVMGIGFLVTSSLVNLLWLRWIAIAWGLAAVLLYAIRRDVEVLPASAALMLLLLALPGFVLWRSQSASAKT
ncbi:MAG: hypothetical protein QOD40_1360 [Alphaproteobacteria bacterium]|nr:hypothetical protein [Alphaproteobacteria bacterium]